MSDSTDSNTPSDSGSTQDLAAQANHSETGSIGGSGSSSGNGAAVDMSPMPPEIEAIENQEWLDSLDYVIHNGGPERTRQLLQHLAAHAKKYGVPTPYSGETSYTNTIPTSQQPEYPGDLEIEERIQNVIRWNAMAMVVRANRQDSSIGGHISTYASSSTLYEVGFQHFFRGREYGHPGDLIYFQGHASPGIYARSFLEGRFKEHHLENFRREMAQGGGLSSYPHPWLMPNYWEFPTVSMGLAPIMSIYQARFNRHLVDRGIIEPNDAQVWTFMGDGEYDEPESQGALTLAGREGLDNINFVINCNLQRLDGPVRGNGKIIQEMEALFRGAGWNVIKVIWGSSWDPLFARDTEGLLAKRLGEIVDGQFQKFSVESGAYIREHLFGTDPRLLAMVEHMSDDDLTQLGRGGHDPAKVYAAYHAAVNHKGQPTVILAKTVKGYGMGESGEGKNVTHQQKKLSADEMRVFRDRFNLNLTDQQVDEAAFVLPEGNTPEMKYLKERRQQLGGRVPARQNSCAPH